VRLANPRSLDAWLARVEAGESAGEILEVPDAAAARAEACFLGLRLREGVSAARFAAEFGAPPRAFYAGEIDRLRARGLLVETAEGDIVLTARGRLLADEATAAFV